MKDTRKFNGLVFHIFKTTLSKDLMELSAASLRRDFRFHYRVTRNKDNFYRIYRRYASGAAQ